MELTLAHRLVLLSLDPRTGARRRRQEVRFAACGAVLADLALLGRVGLDGKRVAVLDDELTGEPLLNDTLARLKTGRPARPATWCARTPALVRVDTILDDLVRGGYVRREPGRALGLIPVTRYPVLATGVVSSLQAGLAATIAVGVTPESDAQVQLARLLFEAHLRKAAFPTAGRGAAKARILELDRLRWPGDGVRRAIGAQQAAAGS